VRVRGGVLRKWGKNFPVNRFYWNENHTYQGCEIDRLWFSDVIGEHAYGNLIATWRGPMDVQLENVRDQTERIGWGAGIRIRGPDLFHVVCEFPQIGNDLKLMYAFQAMLADELAFRLFELGTKPTITGADIYVSGGKLNVGICSATTSSCTMHFGANISLGGEPGIPEGVVACGLADFLDGGDDRAVELMEGVVEAWANRIEKIHLKAYKTI
jgi:hypothetical protein